jgi:hypothetical protein
MINSKSARRMLAIAPLLVITGLLTTGGAQQSSSPPAELMAAIQQVQAALSKPLSDKAKKWRCNITSQYYCSPEKGCSATEPSTWIYVSFRDKKYSRCDKSGCDSYEFVSIVSGAWTKITSPSAGMLLSIRNDGGSFAESASRADEFWTGFGKCTPEA